MSLESKIYNGDHLTEEVKEFINAEVASHPRVDNSFIGKIKSLNIVSRFLDLNTQIHELEVNKEKFHSGRVTEIKRGFEGSIATLTSPGSQFSAEYQVDQLIDTKMLRLQEEKHNLMIKVAIGVGIVAFSAIAFSGLFPFIVTLASAAVITQLIVYPFLHDLSSEKDLREQEETALNNLKNCMAWDKDGGLITPFSTLGQLSYSMNLAQKNRKIFNDLPTRSICTKTVQVDLVSSII